jgi:hypothetical protein
LPLPDESHTGPVEASKRYQAASPFCGCGGSPAQLVVPEDELALVLEEELAPVEEDAVVDELVEEEDELAPALPEELEAASDVEAPPFPVEVTLVGLAPPLALDELPPPAPEVTRTVEPCAHANGDSAIAPKAMPQRTRPLMTPSSCVSAGPRARRARAGAPGGRPRRCPPNGESAPVKRRRGASPHRE